MLPDERLQACLQKEPVFSPARVVNPGLHLGATAAPQFKEESQSLPRTVAMHLPGEFVSDRYEADCARFVAEAKRLARCRSEALLRGPTASC